MSMPMPMRLLVAFLLAQAGMLARAPALEPLVDVEQIRALPREDAARALPVRLSGVVVYTGWQDFVLHDGKAAIFLDFQFARQQGVWKDPLPDLSKLPPGTGVEIEGVTDPGGFSPMVLVAKYKIVGPKPLPPPVRPTTEEMLSSAYDTGWVEVRGVVRSVEASPGKPAILMLLVGGHRCPVLLRDTKGITRERFVDARVKVRGVLLNIANLRSQTAGMKIHATGIKDIDILIPPPSAPFKAPKVALNRLLTYRPDADLGHRRVSTGLVLFAVPGRFFYLLDQGASVRVDSQDAKVAPGDLVEVSGFIGTSRLLASFNEALVRKIGTGTVPSPDQPPISEILNPKTRSQFEMVAEPGHPDFDGRLIRLNGVLRRVLPPDKDGNSIVIIESGEHLVQAFLAGPAPSWVPGSAVELTGICELEMAKLDTFPWFSITGFHVWLSSPTGVRVLSQPPWWTPQRLGILLAAVVLILGLALAWGYALRRQVAVRGTQLAAEISARESAKLKFETVLRERRRLANDLHDNLEQSLTGLALQLEIASRSRTSNPALCERHLNLARHFVERSRNEAHRTIWDLRAHGQGGRDFIDIFKERVFSMIEGSGVNITLDQEGDATSLPDLIAGNLLLLAQEAVTNALKHSAASEIRTLFRWSPEYAEVEVQDNGHGFDVSNAPGQQDGHFGMQGMRERTKRLNGEIEFLSSAGQGTTIRVRLPLIQQPALDSA